MRVVVLCVALAQCDENEMCEVEQHAAKADNGSFSNTICRCNGLHNGVVKTSVKVLPVNLPPEMNFRIGIDSFLWSTERGPPGRSDSFAGHVSSSCQTVRASGMEDLFKKAKSAQFTG